MLLYVSVYVWLDKKCDVTRPLPKKVYLGFAVENVRADSKTASYDLNARDILIRQHFQVTCDTWKVFQVKQLT